MTGIHAWSALGFTHASIVIPLERSSEFESATVTSDVAPSNEAAAPYFPAAVHVVEALREPALPFPDVSAAVVPAPSSNESAATRPVGGGGGGGGGGATLDTVTVTALDVVACPAASRATAVSVCRPFAAVDVSHVTPYGAVASSAPRFVPSSLNCTPATPTSSDALADTATPAPETVLPSTGAVIETEGAA